jgi:hypothetical protein
MKIEKELRNECVIIDLNVENKNLIVDFRSYSHYFK